MNRTERRTRWLMWPMALLAVAVAAGCGGGGGQEPATGVPVASIAPTVTGTTNANGATNVPVNTRVGATFSEPMDPSSVTAATFLLMQGDAVVPAAVSYSGVSAVLVPSAILAPATRYTGTIRGGAGGARDLAGNSLAVDFSWSWTTGAATDTLAPKVSGTINGNGATGVAVNTKVGAIFSEPMDPLTITATTMFLTHAAGAVPGTVSYSGVSAVLVPAGALAPSTRYTVTMRGGAGGVKDLAGNSLAGDYSWFWTTGTGPDTVAPTVSATIHADGATDVALNTKVGATFSEPMDPLTITNKTFLLMQGTTAVAGTVSYSGVSALFIPLSSLAPGTGYTVTVKGGAGGAKDLAGNALAGDHVLAWTTGAGSDTGSPAVVSTTIPDGATNVAIDALVGASFSEAMDPLTITNVTCTLVETATGTLTGAETVSYAGTSLEFQVNMNDFGPLPPTFLRANTRYTVTISGGAGGVTDLAGNPMAGDRAWSFTTGP